MLSISSVSSRGAGNARFPRSIRLPELSSPPCCRLRFDRPVRFLRPRPALPPSARWLALLLFFWRGFRWPRCGEPLPWDEPDRLSPEAPLLLDSEAGNSLFVIRLLSPWVSCCRYSLHLLTVYQVIRHTHCPSQAKLTGPMHLSLTAT